jgi:hypothetical protein
LAVSVRYTDDESFIGDSWKPEPYDGGLIIRSPSNDYLLTAT